MNFQKNGILKKKKLKKFKKIKFDLENAKNELL
ncbi:MAG: hypothetical protein CM15mP29_4470 [Alphaproteobacteria bacterium]|nr:MAG: hypothetical protein CM15mP29_4470 [Alphaproteobacteria bacterium]